MGIARSNVEDLLLVATLLDKHQAQVDLRQELDLLLKESDSGADEASKRLPKFGDKKTTKAGLLFFLKAGPHK